jgi:heme/copper-type cytochrome/quinol oxidase subunit 2
MLQSSFWQENGLTVIVVTFVICVLVSFFLCGVRFGAAMGNVRKDAPWEKLYFLPISINCVALLSLTCVPY